MVKHAAQEDRAQSPGGDRATTELRNTLKELEEAKARAEAASHFKTQMLAMVSHELRTPLAAIKGYTTTMLDYYHRLSEAQHREFLEVIDEETDLLTDMVTDLLDLSCLEAGRFALRREPTDIGLLLHKLVNRLGLTHAQPTLDLDVEAGLPLLEADPHRLQQVFRNLLNNALRYTPDNGTITIRASQEADHLLVSLSDTGPDIPPEEQERIFEPFQRGSLPNGYQPATSRAGLGLSICRRLVDAHGGSITVESQPGSGTTFYVRLPIRAPQP